jgi:hypothetical protein
MLRILDQDGPVAWTKSAQVRGLERTVLQRPLTSLPCHETALGIRVARKCHHLLWRERLQRLAELRKGSADEQGLFLPMALHELGGAETAEKDLVELTHEGRKQLEFCREV